MKASEFYHAQLVTQHGKMLRNLVDMLCKAREFAIERKCDEQALLADRLAPDMHPLTRQVQIAADTARLAAARIAGRHAPTVPGPEETVEGLCRYVEEAIAYLQGFEPADFSGGDGQIVVFPWKPGQGLRGRDYFTTFAVPNVYFHVAAVYMILRTNGVNLGKADFLGRLPFVDA